MSNLPTDRLKVGETVTLTAEQFNSLMAQSEELTALENGGVDNWDWYYESKVDYHENTGFKFLDWDDD